MEDLFRFVALRAPEEADPDQTIDLTNRKSEYQAALEDIHHPAPSMPPSDLVTAALRPSASFGARARAIPWPGRCSALPDDGNIHPLPPLPLRAASRAAGSRCRWHCGSPWPYPRLVWRRVHLGYRLPAPGLLLYDFYASLSTGSPGSKAQRSGHPGPKGLQQPPSRTVVADPEFQKEKVNLTDSMIAIFIHPLLHANPIGDMAQILRLMDLLIRIAAKDKTLNDPGAVLAALTRSLLLPPLIFPLRLDLPKPVGVGDLLVVRQHIQRYEPGEIANIENILRARSAPRPPSTC